MSVHTYIGARYVPRFLGIYDPTQIYEALDVVDNGSGTSYIARDIVPAGTPLTDTDHWFVYGASSGAIIALQNDMIQAQNDILGLQSDVEDLGIKVNRGVIIITDSYGVQTNADGDTFTDVFQSLISLPAGHFYTANAPGASFKNSNPALEFQTLLQGVTVADPDLITDVIVVGGANDIANSVNDTLGKIWTFAAYVRATYPNATTYLFPCGLTFTTAGMNSCYTRVIPAYTQAAKYGAYMISNSQYLLRNSKLLNAGDLCHPNADGVDLIGNSLAKWFKGSNIDVSYTLKFPADGSGETITAELSGGGALSISANGSVVNQERTNGVASLLAGDTVGMRLSNGGTPFNISIDSGVNLTFSHTINVGRSDIYPSYRVIALNASTGTKTYLGIAYWDVTTSAKVLKVRFKQAIPSSDNAAYLDLYFDSTEAAC